MSRPRQGVAGSNQENWLEQQRKMGGQFWPPMEEEVEMPLVGDKYPMMLYDGQREVIVYDDKEFEEASKNGFKPHPSMEISEAPPSPKPEPPTEPEPGPDKASVVRPKGGAQSAKNS